MSDPLKEKSFAFALRITNLAEYMQKEMREFTLSRKILDSGVNIGLFIEEARQGETVQIFDKNIHLRTKKRSRQTLC